MTRVLLLSDLHLPNTPSPLRTAFQAFLDGPARGASAVYILGDLFEYWIGDAEGARDYAPETAALRRLAESGVSVYFMHGNRDFLIGAKFARIAGMHLLADPQRIQLGGVSTLLSHGDLWCTDDHAYQRWRRFSRHARVQAAFRTLPEFFRRCIAGTARSQSRRGKARKTMAIMDVNAAAISAAFSRHGVARMIHGHTHRPGDHHLALADRAAERIVLADWRPGHCEYLVVDERGVHRETVGDGVPN